ncbi:MAG: DUF4258 domain-containing protein [Verrucomicrobiota bacterium]|jgi:hypothetical protein
MNYELTQHARDVLAERQLPVEWPERALREPELRQPDPTEATLERRYRQIPERGNRVLRVVVNTTVAPERVVSVYFDRTMKGKL